MIPVVQRLFHCRQEPEDQESVFVRKVAKVPVHACIDLCMMLLVTEIGDRSFGREAKEDLLVIVRIAVSLHQVFLREPAGHLGYGALGYPEQV